LALGDQKQAPTVRRWECFELTLPGSRGHRNPFTDVLLEATFTAPSKRQLRAWGFYDGSHSWRLRFMPDETGQWRYQARFSDGSPGAEGIFKCVKGSLHGPLCVSPKNPLWFTHADGRPFYLRAFHLWNVDALDEATLKKTLDFLKAQGFNAIVGPHLTPDRMVWERQPDGKVEFRRFNLKVWHGLDRALFAMADRGMVLIPFSIVGGTNGLPKVPDEESLDLLLRYWVARWGGFWNATLQPTSEWEEGYGEQEILSIGQRLRELGEGRHLISVHALRASSARVQRAGWFSYHTVQDKLTNWNPMKYNWLADLFLRAPKPILAHECLWEGNFYQKEAGLDVDNLRRAAWAIALSGGQINYADEVVPPRRWQRREDEGKTFSEQGMAMQPQGQFYRQLKVLGDFLQSLPFWQMTPHPEVAGTRVCLAEVGCLYVLYAAKGGPVSLDLGGAQGSFTARWLNPRDGRLSKPFSIQSGSSQELQTPDDRDWVLYLKKQARAL